MRTLLSGVPQDSVLGPLLFLLYAADLGGLVSRMVLSSHFYVDDSQLSTSDPSTDVLLLQLRCLVSGVEELATWMRSNRLLMNPEKTDCGVPLAGVAQYLVPECMLDTTAAINRG